MQIKLKNKLLLLKFCPEAVNDLKVFGITGENMWAVVREIEPEGIWIEHPSYKCGIWWDEKGNFIPQDRRTEEKFEADVFIRWNYIKGLICIRDRRFERVKNETGMGFKKYED